MNDIPAPPKTARAEKLKAVFFDLDDTLCDDASAWERCARLSAELGARRDARIDPAALASAFLEESRRYWAGPDCFDESRPLHEVRAAQWRCALQTVGRFDISPLADNLADEYRRLRITEIALFPDALCTLRILRSSGLQLVLITNGFRATHVEKIAHLGLEPCFDYVIIADIVGHFKPSGRIFRHALDLCGRRPDEAVMVGDDPVNDVAGAEAAGICAIWFNPERKALPRGAQPPSGGEVAALGELPALLG